MKPAHAQRQIALAGVALLAAVVGLAIANRAGGSQPSAAERGSVPVVGSGWYRAVAAPYRPADGQRSACGLRLAADSFGVAHSVLPCGARIAIAYDDEEAIAHVIDRGPTVAGRDFDVTQALARELGLRDAQPIKWRFAR